MLGLTQHDWSGLLSQESPVQHLVMHSHAASDGAGRQGLRRTPLCIRESEAEMAQSLLLDHGQPSFRSHVLEHPAHFRHVVTSTYVSQYAGPQVCGSLPAEVIERQGRVFR